MLHPLTQNRHLSLHNSLLGSVYMEWGPRFSGVGFFCFYALRDTKQKKPTPLDRGPPLHINKV